MRRQRKPDLWPPYQSIETLSAALDMKVEYVQQLVRRGILPPPIIIAETERYDFALVTERLTKLRLGVSHADIEQVDPYLRALNGTPAEIATARTACRREGQDLLLLSEASADRACAKADQASG